jgi:hypothetical protein
MKPAFSVPLKSKKAATGDRLLLGTSSWSEKDTSLKYGWPDKKGRFSRGGELPTWAIPQAVLLAAGHGYLPRKDMARIAKGLVDILAAPQEK